MSCLLLGSDCTPYACAQCTANERGYDEHPEVLEGLSAYEESGAYGTGGVHGSTGQVDAHQVNEHQGETDGYACVVACTNLGSGGTENYEHEDEGGNALYEECTAYASGIGDGVGAEACRVTHCAGSSGHLDDEEEYGCTEYTAYNLAYPISAGILPAHTAGESYAEGDGGIDVATGDAADGVCHGNYGEAECEGCAHYACGVTATEEYCCTAAKECENHCSYTLSNVLFHNLYLWFMVSMALS